MPLRKKYVLERRERMKKRHNATYRITCEPEKRVDKLIGSPWADHLRFVADACRRSGSYYE